MRGNRHWLFLLVAVSACAFTGPGTRLAHEGMHATEDTVASVSLCEALSAISPGEMRPIVLSGIFTSQHLLYDPSEPICRSDVQPSTLVEFVVPKETRAELDRIVAKDYRAAVTFRGRLFGPPSAKPDDPSLIPPFAYMQRVAGRRYEKYNNYFRTKFVVDGIDAIARVPATVPRHQTWHRTRRSLRVLSGETPVYPWQARYAGVSGEVHLEVTIEKGAVSAVKLISGDRLLCGDDGAIAVVRSWRFDPMLSTTFSTVFQYELESRDTGSSDLERVEMELPTRVRIIAPSDGW